jgi:hypothetical protein
LKRTRPSPAFRSLVKVPLTVNEGMLQTLKKGICAELNALAFLCLSRDGVLYRTSLRGDWEDARW